MGRWVGLLFIGLGIWQFFAGGQGLLRYRIKNNNGIFKKKIVNILFKYGIGSILILFGLIRLFVK